MFRKLLIANRGEIARRVIRTARRLNIRTVAVYSDADAAAPHVREADEAYRIGPPPPGESYLKGDLILDCAAACGAEAMHPGYGFLSENAEFAEACAARNIAFVGPPASAIRAMGDKAASKRLMRDAGVPLAPGYDEEDQDPAVLAAHAAEIGWPVMIKASAGGGGKGMRVVRSEAEFTAALESCQREAAGAFGDTRVLIEKLIERPRHVEVQVFADSHGVTLHLLDRDCSAQRRHQKVIEEAPAPNLPLEIAEEMRAAAIRAAAAVGYQGAGTVEFLVAQDAAGQAGAFYFMEMNTRLQVEHPVTERILGLDLVEWQLRVAAGEPLPLTQHQIVARARGASIEARLYAEDPEADFLPATGRLSHLSFPAHVAFDPSAPGLRVDAGVVDGDVVSPHYDPMIAKMIATGADREAARVALLTALEETRVVGPATNRAFLRRLVACDDFRDARLDTGLIARNAATLNPPARSAPFGALAAAAVAEAWESGAAAGPFAPSDGWRHAGPAARRLVFAEVGRDAETPVTIALVQLPDRRDETTRRFRLHDLSDADGPPPPLDPEGGSLLAATREGDRVDLVVDDLHRVTAHVIPERTASADLRHVFFDGDRWSFARIDPLARAGALEEDVGGLRAPMPGKIARRLAAPGAIVARGDALLVIEAMKMEHTIAAPGPGAVTFLVEEGDQVAEGEALAEIAEG